MKNQIITALSIVAVLGAASGAYAANQSVLSSASSEPSVIGTATPVLVPVAPKGSDIPEEYRQRLADAESGTIPGQGDDGTSTETPAVPVQPAPPTAGNSAGSYDDDDDDDEYEDESHESEDDESDDESHESEDETDDDD
ncbi:hypothetical protein [Microcella frigidaquae]|uniref:Uncharacterized protein n=1 Tax=Microcella frigidaquae TaxID=424758 RepID=A0A840XPY0_9MICO|nr:hypothetical protein [Microcella frigidaquae]MBB5617989.1 hypothetical protein [Microcella frigidaquae]NHN44298.1 hypothetical protein [Microcella frigidaquae]